MNSTALKPERIPELVLIAAVAANGVIGRAGQLPWHLPEDLAHFRALTLGHTVIMGRKTWESLPLRFRPLPGRQNIVVTRNAEYQASGAVVAHSLADALALCATDTVFVIGGEALYQAALPLAQRLELTELAQEYQGDACFPAFCHNDWQPIDRNSQYSVNGMSYCFATYLRK